MLSDSVYASSCLDDIYQTSVCGHCKNQRFQGMHPRFASITEQALPLNREPKYGSRQSHTLKVVEMAPTITRVALVNGANRGIGLAISKQLSASGFTVIMGARNKEKGIESCKTTGPRLSSLQNNSQLHHGAAGQRIARQQYPGQLALSRLGWH